MITTIDGKTMGGLYRLRVPTAQVFSGLKALTQDVLDRIDTQMSAWISHSDLCRFNVTPVGEWVSIPSDMANVVALGLQMSTFTDGALNICLGQQSRAFGFMPGKVGGSNFSDANTALDLDLENTMLRRRTDVVLDLNAIAKGYAADLVCSTLRQSGVRDMMIEVAGDICAIGQRPDQNPWTVAMELPLSDRIVPIRFVPLKDQAMACSGNYRRFKDSLGHIIDPRAGQPLPATPSSVIVLAPSAAEADALATSLYVMGAVKGMKFARQHSLAAAFITPIKDGFKEEATDQFAALILH